MRRREFFNCNKPEKLVTVGDNQYLYDMWITGGHYNMSELRELYPEGYDDLDILRVLEHGYVRFEFVSDFDRDDDEKQAYFWHNKPVRGAAKATNVLVQEKEQYRGD